MKRPRAMSLFQAIRLGSMDQGASSEPLKVGAGEDDVAAVQDDLI